jgi:hypothetical protein
MSRIVMYLNNLIGPTTPQPSTNQPISTPPKTDDTLQNLRSPFIAPVDKIQLLLRYIQQEIANVRDEQKTMERRIGVKLETTEQRIESKLETMDRQIAAKLETMEQRIEAKVQGSRRSLERLTGAERRCAIHQVGDRERQN